ncbi:MAG TPA: PUR family DNA/RNA-binding protein [Methylomirabilota bacterium]|nr:PUR family DNA/RNA-binding protein [Methylomirabilota bacterium]
MTSDERSPALGPSGGAVSGSRPAPAQEETIKTERIQIERKGFVFALKENPRGRFLRITEDVGGRRDTIIVPAPGLEEFRRVIDEMLRASADQPTRSP